MDSNLCLIRSMLEFPHKALRTPVGSAMLQDVMGIITASSARPRYTFMVLDLISRVADREGRAGPYVRQGEELVPIREWLAAAISPTASRHHQRKATIENVRNELQAKGLISEASDDSNILIAEEVAVRVRASGMTAISRAVSELVRAGLIKRHYQGYRLDHKNRGAQRQAVYTVAIEARQALGLHPDP